MTSIEKFHKLLFSRTVQISVLSDTYEAVLDVDIDESVNQALFPVMEKLMRLGEHPDRVIPPISNKYALTLCLKALAESGYFRCIISRGDLETNLTIQTVPSGKGADPSIDSSMHMLLYHLGKIIREIKADCVRSSFQSNVQIGKNSCAQLNLYVRWNVGNEDLLSACSK